MKKKITVILICILLGSFSGMYLWYQLKEIYIKKQVAELIKKGIHRDDLVLLKFTYSESESELHWEHSKEFEYNNLMYDVVEIEYKDDSVYYWCWLDKKETEVKSKIKNIANLVIPNDLNVNRPNKSHRNDLNNLFCQSIYKKEIYLNYSNLGFVDYPHFYSSIVYSPLTPPPK